MLKRPHVALIVETSLNSGREILRGIAAYAREHGPWQVFHEPRSLESAAPRWLESWRGDGIIARLQNARLADTVAAVGIPAVDVLGESPHPAVPLVHVDNEAIGRLGAEHLMDCGFRSFGWCGVRGRNWAAARLAAFGGALDAKLDSKPAVYWMPACSSNQSSWERQQDRLAAWLAKLPKPVGIAACYDPLAQRVLEACRRAEVAVPDEAAVLGVDNDDTVCEVCDPPLSSVAANLTRVGFEAARLLDRLMHGKAAPKRPVAIEPARVVVRQSTDSLAIPEPDVAAAVRFIREHACRPIHVRDVVSHLAISNTVLKERFRKWVGHSVHDEITHVRIHEAKRLLATTDLSLRQIAHRLGYRQQECLGVVFKKNTGKTPGQYRSETRI